MQLTVVCLLGIASCAYAQFAGVGIAKNVSVDLPFFSFDISKGFGIGGGLNRRKRDVNPNDPPERPRLIGNRGIGIKYGDRFKPRPEPEDSAEVEANGPKSQPGKLGVGAPGHLFPHPPPFRPHHHGRRPSTTSPPETTESSDQSSEASSEESNESNSEPSSEPDSESSSNASSEASNEDSNESN